MATNRILATDLDGTFIGDDAAMEGLWHDLEAAGVFVAFSTGRHLGSIRDFYNEVGTARRASACITMVGTEVWFRRNGEYERDHGWSDVISHAWNKEKVEEIVTSIPGVEMQPMEWQSPFKSSYFLEHDGPARVSEIEASLAGEGLAAKVVYSADRFLDLLPSRSGKGGAVRYLAQQLGVSADQVITAGDTGNDLDMMRPELGFRSIAVGNASPELAEYRVPNVYHARAPYASGIREGLEAYGWLERR